MNILVGPNNAGKSTVVGAFRALAAAMRTARSKNPQFFAGPSRGFGYSVPAESIPISLENAQTDLQDVEATITFHLSNENRLILSFPPGYTDCFLYADAPRRITSTTSFKEAYPIDVIVVPVLGPTEHEEELVEQATVERNLATHRASRNFRSYWWYHRDGFGALRDWIQQTWPEIAISPPERGSDFKTLAMFCVEGRMTRELYWIGTGFQIWCQLLTHMLRARESTLLVIDEAEIYLHPDLQRKLMSILRELGPDVIVATHSTELVGESEPTEILLIDKARRAAQRLRSLEKMQLAFERLGSVHMLALTQIARKRRVVFVEGDDFKLIRRFAKALGLDELADGLDVVPFPIGGFRDVQFVRMACEAISQTVGVGLLFGGVFDRDFRSAEEAAETERELKSHLRLVKLLERKEIENYLLVPSVLARAVSKAITERASRLGIPGSAFAATTEILEDITMASRLSVQAQYISKRTGYMRKGSSLDNATVTQKAIEVFEHRWASLETRMEIVSGKETLAKFNERLQQGFGVNVTPTRIIKEFHKEEVPEDLRDLLSELDQFRTSQP